MLFEISILRKPHRDEAFVQEMGNSELDFEQEGFKLKEVLDAS